MQDYDEQAQNELKELMGNGVRALVDTYLASAKSHMDNIKHGLEDKSLQSIRDAAHPLKSSSGNMGFPKLCGLAKAMEYSADQMIDKGSDDFQALSTLHQELEEAYLMAQKRLKELSEL